MAQGSLFAVLMRSPWWYSAIIALVLIAIGLLLAGGNFLAFGIAASLPFLGISGYAGWRQLQRPSSRRLAEAMAMARSMSPRVLTDTLAQYYRDKGYEVSHFPGAAADLEIERGARKLLLLCTRFKAANTGVEPLKKLVAAGEKIEATGYIYVVLGAVSDNAGSYARQQDIELMRIDGVAEVLDYGVKTQLLKT